MSQTTPEIKDVLGLLQELDKETNFELFIPSLQKSVRFKQLTTEQLKRILKSVIDSPVYNTEFIKAFNVIIKENCLDPDVETDTLTLYDKTLIIFKTKIASLSPDFNFIFTDEEIESNNLAEKNKVVNLEEHFNRFLNEKINFEPLTIEYNNSIITCNIPTLFTENKLENELHKNVKIDVTTPEELRTVIGDTFINEITKFITNININGTHINLLRMTFKNRIAVVEKLPTQVINKVIKYIEQYRATLKPLFSYKLKVQTTSQTTVDLEKDIPVDATFFNM